MTARELTIVQLLERYDDLVDPMQAGLGNGSSGYLRMPPSWNDSVRELERLLREMRDSRHAPIVKWHADGKQQAASPRKLWWHLNARYLACPTVLKDVPVKRRTKRGKTVTVLQRTVVRAANGSLDVYVERGVTWLAEGWSLSHEPALPKEPKDREQVAA